MILPILKNKTSKVMGWKMTATGPLSHFYVDKESLCCAEEMGAHPKRGYLTTFDTKSHIACPDCVDFLLTERGNKNLGKDFYAYLEKLHKKLPKE